MWAGTAGRITSRSRFLKAWRRLCVFQLWHKSSANQITSRAFFLRSLSSISSETSPGWRGGACGVVAVALRGFACWVAPASEPSASFLRDAFLGP